MGPLDTPRAAGVLGLPSAANSPQQAQGAPPASPRLPPPTDVHRQRYAQIFHVLHTQREQPGVSREKGFSVLQKSGLPTEVLEQIWALSDLDGDGALDLSEFVLAMHLTNAKVKMQVELPERLPAELIPPGKQLPPLR